jgi:nucleoside-diphosphate-sugar epimerase
MKSAVFGGSGVIGRRLLPELIDKGHAIRAMHHKAPLDGDGLEVVAGSITDPTAVADTVAGADVVLQLTKGGGGIEQTVETSVRGTVNILDAARAAGGVTQYLLTSSDAAVGICAHPFPEPISHATEPVSYGDYYSLGKVLEETIVTDFHRNHGIPYTIARLSWTMRDDLILKLFVAGYNRDRPTGGVFSSGYTEEQRRRLGAGERFVVLACDREGRPLARTLVQREDVIAGLLAMIGNSDAINDRFHLSGPAFRYDVPAEYLGHRLDLPVERVALPDEHSFEIDVSHTTDRVGWSPQYDVRAMIDAALARKG